MSAAREVIDWTIHSLTSEPGAWLPYRIGGKTYFLTHRNGVEVWVANGHYGLHISCRGDKIGDVTPLSAVFGWLTPWRRRVRAAAIAICGPDNPHQAHERLLQAIRGLRRAA